MYTETLMLPSISQKHENIFTVQKFYDCHHQKVFICTFIYEMPLTLPPQNNLPQLPANICF